MADELRKTTLTFSRPAQLAGAGRVLPAGDYLIEWRQHFLDDVSLPEAPATEVRLHLGTDDAAEVLTVAWVELRAALLRDRAPLPRPGKPPVDDLLADPLIRLVMSSDGLSDHAVRRALRAARMRRTGLAPLAGRPRHAPQQAPGRGSAGQVAPRGHLPAPF